MGLRTLSITLANSIIGVGILAMPFCFQQCGAILATLMLILSNLVSRLTCHFLLKSALLVRRRNIQFLALHVFGPSAKLAVEIGIIGFMMGTCIAYFVVVGDLGPQIIAKMFAINQSNWLRTSIMIVVSLVCVLPLGLLRNVDSLNNVSAATIGFYICLIIKIMAEAAARLFTKDWWNKFELWKADGVMQCVPIFAMALSCQTQLFELFESTPTLPLEKMNAVSKNALNLCSLVYLLVGLFGYIAFCTQNISGNILVSLSSTMASDMIKLGFVMSLAFSFPLVIFPCRASIYSLLYRRAHSTSAEMVSYSIPTSAFRVITVIIIAVTLLISLLIPNIELVLGLVGSTIGVAVCFVFPSLCFISLTYKNTNERVLAQFTVFFGLLIVVLGTLANLQAAENTLEHNDYRHLTQEKIDKIVDDFMQKHEYEFRVNQGYIDKPPTPPEAIRPEDPKQSVISSQDKKAQPKQFNELNKVNKVENFVQENKLLEDNKEIVVKKETDQNKYEGAGDNEMKSVDKVVENIPKTDVKDKEAEDKDLLKQQLLVETIKQHRVEQKELIKEQKEILDEIIKTKLEIQKNKVEEAKIKEIKVEEAKIKETKEQKLTDMAADVKKVNGVELETAVQNVPIVPNLQNKDLEKVQNSIKNARDLPSKSQEINPSIDLNKVPIALAMKQIVNENTLVVNQAADTLDDNKRVKREVDVSDETDMGSNDICEKKDEDFQKDKFHIDDKPVNKILSRSL